jgi:hypothetical protein
VCNHLDVSLRSQWIKKRPKIIIHKHGCIVFFFVGWNTSIEYGHWHIIRWKWNLWLAQWLVVKINKQLCHKWLCLKIMFYMKSYKKMQCKFFNLCSILFLICFTFKFEDLAIHINNVVYFFVTFWVSGFEWRMSMICLPRWRSIKKMMKLWSPYE